MQREHLLAAYETAVRAFENAVMQLPEKHGAEFEKANQEINRLHADVEKMREGSQHHRREHGCGWHAASA